jgi:cytochrome oxidase assembly protein ShyY1
MTAPNENQEDAGNRRRYAWPWYLLGAVLLAIALAVLWMSKEVERVRRIRDANAPAPGARQTP